MIKQKEKNVVAVVLRPHFNSTYNRQPIVAKEYDMPSMTRPDMSMTVKQLIDRFMSGKENAVGQQQYFDGIGDDVQITDDYLAGQKWAELDISEKFDIIENAKNDFAKINAGIQKFNDDKKKAAEAARQKLEERNKKIEEYLEKQKAGIE